MDVRDESVTPEVKAILQHTLDFVPLDFGGGSSILKATAVANLIIENGYETIVEIGVYRGRFLLPQATLFRYLGRGTAYGVDPYRALSAIQLDARRFPVPARRVNQWVREQDWDGLYAEVLARISALGLDRHCQILRTTSRRAAPSFATGSVDVVHIDGNHDRRRVEGDVRRWLPKLRPGGVMVFDDRKWSTIQPVVAQVSKLGEVVADVDDPGTEDFVIVRIDAPGPP